MRRRIVRVKKANPVSMENALIPVIREIGLGANIFLDKIAKNWEDIVGKTNAINTKPADLNNGVLTLVVSSPVWMTQARFYKSTFIKKINNFCNQYDNTIHEIKFELDRS